MALARIWAAVLRVDRIGLDDDFFALGGDSIQLFQITARANSSGFRLAAKDVLRHPNVGALARRLDERQPEVRDRAPASPPTPIGRVREPEAEWPRRTGARRAGEGATP